MKIILILLASFLFVTGCSSLKETGKSQPAEDVYVFDDVESIDADAATDTLENRKQVEELPADEVKKKTVHFIVQLAAFSNRNNAEKFVEINSNKTEYELNIIYKEEVKMYTVQLFPFDSIEKAEMVRDELRKIPEFKNAFIFTVDD
ncbi:SPOR domain-containing protein [Melioribacter sp. Ez-97]|uniref:SPOR domain-containing protein n=1 Tax=Melioribacter sp. Ez-97 TaxID=3423434 RepID=UPI003EDB1801